MERQVKTALYVLIFITAAVVTSYWLVENINLAKKEDDQTARYNKVKVKQPPAASSSQVILDESNMLTK
jgi:hypothetical protein